MLVFSFIGTPRRRYVYFDVIRAALVREPEIHRGRADFARHR